MFGGAQLFGDVCGGLQFDLMALTVIERKAVAGVVFFAGNGEADGRIQTAAEKTNGAFVIESNFSIGISCFHRVYEQRLH